MRCILYSASPIYFTKSSRSSRLRPWDISKETPNKNHGILIFFLTKLPFPLFSKCAYIYRTSQATGARVLKSPGTHAHFIILLSNVFRDQPSAVSVGSSRPGGLILFSPQSTGNERLVMCSPVPDCVTLMNTRAHMHKHTQEYALQQHITHMRLFKTFHELKGHGMKWTSAPSKFHALYTTALGRATVLFWCNCADTGPFLGSHCHQHPLQRNVMGIIIISDSSPAMH